MSHSNIKTKRRFMPNLRNVTLISDALGRRVRVRVSANALKTVDHRGGLDAFLLKAKDAELAPKMLELKRQIVKKKAKARPRWRRAESDPACDEFETPPRGGVFICVRLFPHQRELQQQIALEHREIVVRNQREMVSPAALRCTAMPSMLSIW